MSLAWSYTAPATLGDEQLGRWAALVESRTGIDLSQHLSILRAGLRRRWRELDWPDPDEYFETVSAWPEGMVEWRTLIDCITVQETCFFRQREAFDLVYRYLLERLRCAPPRSTLDLWSVGCSTGEEAYSLGMVALRARARAARASYSGVLATDISEGALRVARAGRYSDRRIAALPAALKNSHWRACEGEPWQCTEELREQVCFVQGNALELDRTPSVPMDVIFCQNVLVYFRRWRRRQVLNTLVGRLKPGGLLIVGAGEAAQWQHSAVRRLPQPAVQAYVRSAQRAVAAAG